MRVSRDTDLAIFADAANLADRIINRANLEASALRACFENLSILAGADARRP
jgi:hypothetical protein